MRVVLAWLRSHPKSTIAVGALALVFGVHRFIEWNTERRWQQYRAEAAARGVKFTLEELVTPEIPDEENFAALPMWRTVLAAPPAGFAFSNCRVRAQVPAICRSKKRQSIGESGNRRSEMAA